MKNEEKKEKAIEKAKEQNDTSLTDEQLAQVNGSGIDTFSTMWISKSEFEESGASIVHRKCF